MNYPMKCICSAHSFIHTFLIYLEFTVVINIDFPSIPTAGDEFSFTCTAIVPETLVLEPTDFLISYDQAGTMKVIDGNSDAMQSLVMKNGNIFSKEVTINPIKTSDATNYFCVVVFEQLGVISYDEEMLSVKSEFFICVHS